MELVEISDEDFSGVGQGGGKALLHQGIGCQILSALDACKDDQLAT